MARCHRQSAACCARSSWCPAPWPRSSRRTNSGPCSCTSWSISVAATFWLSLVQSLLQIIYWWHPLLWLANARIRRAREEAVDDAVVLALEGGAEAYAPTLLEVARLALSRPPTGLGLVGILESRSFLRQRIERLLEFRPPRRAGLTLASLFSVAAFAALALPMGQARATATAEPATPSQTQAKVIVADERAESWDAEAASTAPGGFISSNKVSTEESRRAAHLVQDGKLLYEMGKLDEAEATLKVAMRLDQGWKDAAYYYLNLISEARFHERLRDEGGSTRTNLIYTGRGRQIIFDKLNHMRLDEIKGLNNAPLSEVIKVLEE